MDDLDYLNRLTVIAWAVPYLLVVGVLAVYGFHRLCILYLYLKHRRNPPRTLGTFETLPRVTVQLPLYNEVYVVERLLKAVSELDYPRDRLQIQVLDDSTDETLVLSRLGVEELRKLGFDAEWIHRETRAGYKAGALQNGLATCKGEFVLILDADFVPPRELLKETVHFFTDPGVGMVQSRWGHLNSGDSLLTRVQAMFMDGHLVLEQTARCRSGRFFNFNGTAGLWRRRCIDNAGGWQDDTLTEDLDLSYRAQLAGWQFVFLKDLVTPAELPVEMNGFRSQQHRWTKGSIQTCRKHLGAVWKSPLPLLVKLEATVHLTSNFAYLLLVLLCLLLQRASSGGDLLWSGPWRTWLFDVPVFVLASVSVAAFYLCARWEVRRGGWMKDLACLPILLALGVGMSINNSRAVLEALCNHRGEFSRTPKYGGRPRRPSLRYRPARSLLPVVEAAFALYFVSFIAVAATAGQWFSVPFLALFALGFAFVALQSVAPFFRPGGRVPPETVLERRFYGSSTA